MKKLLSGLLTAALLVAVASCSNHDDEPETTYKQTDFAGKWFATDDDGYPTVLNLETNHTVTFTQYQDPEGRSAFKGTGIWLLYEGKYLRYDILWDNGLKLTDTFTVSGIASNEMKLVDQASDTSFSFFKITENITVYAGESFDLTAKEGRVVEFSQSSMVRDIEGGYYMAEVPGTLFALIEKDGKVTVTEITINSMSAFFVSQLGQSIDMAKEKFGTPDIETWFQDNMACLWNLDEGPLSAVQYQYDYQTGQITRVLTVYRSQKDYSEEAAYIVQWQPYSEGSETFFPTYDIFESPYFISLMPDKLMISYNDTPYFLANGHFAPPRKQ